MTADECYNEADRLLDTHALHEGLSLETMALRAEIATAYINLGNAKRASAAKAKEHPCTTGCKSTDGLCRTIAECKL